MQTVYINSISITKSAFLLNSPLIHVNSFRLRGAKHIPLLFPENLCHLSLDQGIAVIEDLILIGVPYPASLSGLQNKLFPFLQFCLLTGKKQQESLLLSGKIVVCSFFTNFLTLNPISSVFPYQRKFFILLNTEYFFFKTDTALSVTEPMQMLSGAGSPAEYQQQSASFFFFSRNCQKPP